MLYKGDDADKSALATYSTLVASSGYPALLHDEHSKENQDLSNVLSHGRGKDCGE